MSASKVQTTLDHLFSHPLNMNTKWKDVLHLLESLGAQVEVVHGGREKVRLNGQEATFHIPHSRVLDSKDEVVQIRHFLERCGINGSHQVKAPQA